MQFNKGNLLLTVITALAICAAAPLIAAPPQLQNDEEPKDRQEALKEQHHEQSSTCFECHKDTESDVFQAVMKKNCTGCHKTGWTSGKLETLTGEPDEAAPAEVFTEKASGQGPGMRVPMYYSESRLGPQPNEMILVPAGEFIRGTDSRLPDEGPQHTMDVAAFYIDKFEVTNLQYQRSLQFTGRKPPEHFVNGRYPEGKADHPVVFVSWFDAKAYCNWAGKRLPNDIEWEKAARGTDGRTYPWGDEFSIEYVNSPVRWTTLKLIGDTTPVGAFEKGKSVYGLYDMSGNVWEWTSSRYEAYPGNTRKSENYGGNYRVLKGGSWWDCSFYQCGISAPVYNRSFFHPRTTNNSFGFRCAKDA
jgi:formylglycine-generating enzyme required for sulfatase activity